MPYDHRSGNGVGPTLTAPEPTWGCKLNQNYFSLNWAQHELKPSEKNINNKEALYKMTNRNLIGWNTTAAPNNMPQIILVAKFEQVTGNGKLRS